MCHCRNKKVYRVASAGKKTISNPNFRGLRRLSQLQVGASIVGRAQNVFIGLHSASCMPASAQEDANWRRSRVACEADPDSVGAQQLAVSKR